MSYRAERMDPFYPISIFRDKVVSSVSGKDMLMLLMTTPPLMAAFRAILHHISSHKSLGTPFYSDTIKSDKTGRRSKTYEEYFFAGMGKVIPVAEECGVVMALHPDDPPYPKGV